MFFGIEHYAAFLATLAVLTVTPGIDTVFVLNKALAGGRRAGFYALLGIGAGNAVQTLLAAFGLSLVVARSPLAFAVIKYLGVAYLFYLGVRALLPPGKRGQERNAECMAGGNPAEGRYNSRPGGPSGRSHFVSGFFTNLLNPKIPLFFIALFPQFIAPDAIGQPLPFIVLGLTLLLTGTVWFSLLVLFAGAASQRWMRHPRAGRVMDRVSGAVFILLAVIMAFQ